MMVKGPNLPLINLRKICWRETVLILYISLYGKWSFPWRVWYSLYGKYSKINPHHIDSVVLRAT